MSKQILESKNMIPNVMRQSRDMQSLCKILDLLINNYKTNVDYWTSLIDFDTCPDHLLPLLASYVGYKYDYSESYDTNRLIIKYYPYMIRNRGSEIGMSLATALSVNALGDIYNYKTGEKIAGLLDIERKEFINTCDELDKIESKKDLLNSNTTIGVVITNAKFNKAEMNKIASMARSGYSRSINPVGTMADGDSLYAFSVGEVEADINMVGTMAANVMSEAIIRAIEDSKVSDEEYLSNIK